MTTNGTRLGGLGCASVMVLIAATAGCDERHGGRGSAGGGIDLDSAGASDDPGDDGAHDDDDDGGGDGGVSDDADDDDDGGGGEPADAEPEPELEFDPGALAEVCARNNGDRVARALCNGTQLDSVADVRDALEIELPFFALTGNSTSLVAQTVSAINPRIVIGDRMTAFGDFPFEGLSNDLVAMAFARGDQFVELVGYDPGSDDLNFYLLMFQQSCNATEVGCTTADLVTPAVEEDWTAWTLYQDIDLANTTLDCAVCHQPLGPGTPKIPRMQEVNNSWTHWFPTRPPPPSTGGWGSPSGSSGQTAGLPPEDESHGTRSSEVLWDMFFRMHAGEGSYGGVALDELSAATAGPDMEGMVASYLARPGIPDALRTPGHEASGHSSDYFYDSSDIELVGMSSSWAASFTRAVDGDRLPVPSPRIDITSASSREAAIESYLAYMDGQLAGDDLVDPRRVVSVEAQVEQSLVPRDNATAQEILSHMCARCHNGTLDQTVTRSNFNATSLMNLTEGTRQSIADRIQREHLDKRAMPPARFATLPPWAIERVLAWLDV